MKKIILLLIILLGISSPAYCIAPDDYCPKAPYDISRGFSSFLSSATGVNFLTTQIAENGLEKLLKKELNNNFKVKIETFGGNNLLNGKFKKLTATGKALQHSGMHISSVKAETMCEFNHIKYENDELYFVENMVINYQGKITQDDLKKVITSNEYTNMVNKLAIGTNGILLARIINMDIKIENNKIVMSYDVLVPMLIGSLPKHISFSTGLDVEDGKINFEGIDFGNPNTNKIMKSTLPLINKLNPLSYKVKTTPKNNAIVDVKTVKIINNEIIVDGIILIPKNYNKNNGETKWTFFLN